ncbi:MAG TPA: hypothetical protein VGB47_02410 [Thermoanaerobaculia bacterium]
MSRTKSSIDPETAAPFFRRLGFRDVPRADVPERVRDSLEFRSLSPASAEVVTLALAAPAPDDM